MSASLTPDAIRLVDGANFAHLGTLMSDGSPKVEPVWIGRDRDQLLVATDAATIKAKNVALDPRVALSITSFDDPYEQLLVRGRVGDIDSDEDLVVLDALSEKYLGAPFPRRRWGSRIVLRIDPETVRYYASPLRHPQRP